MNKVEFCHCCVIGYSILFFSLLSISSPTILLYGMMMGEEESIWVDGKNAKKRFSRVVYNIRIHFLHGIFPSPKYGCVIHVNIHAL